MSEEVEDEGMRAVRTQCSASARVFVLVWEGEREMAEGEAMAQRRDEREGGNRTPRGGRERRRRCGGENVGNVKERMECGCALDAQWKEHARFEGKRATLRGGNEHEKVEVCNRGKAGPGRLQGCV